MAKKITSPKKQSSKSDSLSNSSASEEQNNNKFDSPKNLSVENKEGIINLTQPIPVLPLRASVFFPTITESLYVGREKSVVAIEEAMKSRNRYLVLLTQKNPHTESPELKDLYSIGTLAEILQVLKLPDGNIKILAEGIIRIKIIPETFKESESCLFTNGENINCIDNLEDHNTARTFLLNEFKNFWDQNSNIPKELYQTIKSMDDIEKIIDTICGSLEFSLSIKQDILAEDKLKSRFEKVLSVFHFESNKKKFQSQIDMDTRRQIEKIQKDYFINEQIKILKKELGEGDINEFEELKTKIEGRGLSADAKKKAYNELNRLEKMPTISAESTVVRHYLDWLLNLPWDDFSDDQKDIGIAEKILNKNHFALKKAKERLLEFIAVSHLTENFSGPIICLHGPPGVGKTSLARSLAESLGRKFDKISLGGLRDEAEIRGHRRTYIGALPGKILQSLKKCGTKNPLILLDEVDKISSDIRGDPASALLEVLDPEQNKHFQDHFLEMDFDLSNVIFVMTANVIHTIPPPLLDRMERLELSSYTDDEKLNIAKLFLIPKQVQKTGLTKGFIKFSDTIIKTIIHSYTREAGVRELERLLSKIMRKVAKEVVTGTRRNYIKLTTDDLNNYLGPEKYRQEMTIQKPEIGNVNGLAWTETGGRVLQIETVLHKGDGHFTITGNLGDVMKESAKAALSFIKSRVVENVPEKFFNTHDIHLHVPEGAIPKDGPSAGVSIAVALYSAVKNIPVTQDLALSGEITLLGKILPVGGIKEKVLAAARMEIKNIVIPKKNKIDLLEIPDDIKKNIKFYFVETADEIFSLFMKDKN
jgi:ATP-dependent Lon protease